MELVRGKNYNIIAHGQEVVGRYLATDGKSYCFRLGKRIKTNYKHKEEQWYVNLVFVDKEKIIGEVPILSTKQKIRAIRKLERKLWKKEHRAYAENNRSDFHDTITNHFEVIRSNAVNKLGISRTDLRYTIAIYADKEWEHVSDIKRIEGFVPKVHEELIPFLHSC